MPVKYGETGQHPALTEKRHLPVTRNLTRYPYDLQPWGAHASGIAVVPDGTILVNWYGGTCKGVDENEAYRGDPVGASRLYLARLGPQDEQFSDVEVLAGDGMTRFMDANLLADGDQTWAFYVRDGGADDTVVFRLSQDPAGNEWSDETAIDLPHLGRIMNPPVRHDGRLLAPISAFDKRNGPWRDVVIAEMTRDGWRLAARLECRDAQVLLREPCLVSFPDELHMYARVFVADAGWKRADADDARWVMHRAVSRDGGYTWSPVEPLELPNHDSKVSVVSIGGDRLLAAYNPSPRRYPLVFATSVDRGATWSEAGTIDPGPGEMSYPTLFVDGQRRLHVSYTWKRREIHYKEYAIAL